VRLGLTSRIEQVGGAWGGVASGVETFRAPRSGGAAGIGSSTSSASVVRNRRAIEAPTGRQASTKTLPHRVR
jgi:hypothetical protein